MLLTNHIWRELVTDELTKQGLYQWRQIFKGDVRLFEETPPEEYENYDIIHINLCTNDLPIIFHVKSILKNSSTKVIMNVDYAVEMWDRMFPDKRKFIQALSLPDLLFAVEPFQQKILTILSKRDVPLIPHPVDTKRLKQRVKKERGDIAFCLYHRYDTQQLIPSIIAQYSGLEPVMLGIGEGPLPRQIYVLSGGTVPYYSFLNILRMSRIAIEYYTIHSHCRFAGECACLRVPLVATSYSFFAREMFPFTTFHPDEIEKMMLTVKQLVENDAFYDRVVEYAWDKIEDYGWKASKERLLRHIE